MVYDVTRQRVLLFGGFAGLAAPLTDVWEWDGTNWTQRSNTGPGGVTRAAYDPVRGVSVVVGSAGLSPLSPTWEWDGQSWHQRSPTVAPPHRFSFAMTYDEARQRVLLFGGSNPFNPSGPTIHNDTWEWDGSAWTQVANSGPPPRTQQLVSADRR